MKSVLGATPDSHIMVRPGFSMVGSLALRPWQSAFWPMVSLGRFLRHGRDTAATDVDLLQAGRATGFGVRRIAAGRKRVES